jgi:pimeloyl-ACP methyl ester carboxylesterase
MSLLFYNPPWIPRAMKKYIAEKGAETYDFHKKILMDMFKGGLYLLDGRLPKIRAQTLILWGADDRVLPVSCVERFQAGLKECETVVFKDCGHVPYFEKYKDSRDAYQNFLKRVNRDVGGSDAFKGGDQSFTG